MGLGLGREEYHSLNGLIADMIGNDYLSVTPLFLDDNKYLTRSSQARLSQGHFKQALDSGDLLRHLRCPDIVRKSGLASAPALSTCLMHPTWAGDLFHT